MTAPEKCPKCGAEQEKLYYAATEQETALYECGSYSNTGGEGPNCVAIQRNALFIERDALRAANVELEARLAASVPKDVAELACSLMGSAVVANTRDCSLTLLVDCMNSDNVTWKLDQYPSMKLQRACIEQAQRMIARAEAEAAKPQADKEKSDG